MGDMSEMEKFKSILWRFHNPKILPRDRVMTDEESSNAVNQSLMGMSAELGELTNLFENVWYQDADLVVEKVWEEVGGLMYYLSLFLTASEINPNDAAAHLFEQLTARHGEGYVPKEEQNRDE